MTKDTADKITMMERSMRVRARGGSAQLCVLGSPIVRIPTGKTGFSTLLCPLFVTVLTPCAGQA